MSLLFEQLWEMYPQTADTQRPQRTSPGGCSRGAQLFPLAKKQWPTVLEWKFSFFALSCETHQWINLILPSLDFLSPPSITCDLLQSFLFLPPRLNPVFSLGITSPFRSAFVSLDWEKSTILQAYLQLPGAPSPFLSYPSSLFLLCILAAFIFPLPTLLFSRRVSALSTPLRLQLTKPTNYHLLAKSQSVMPALGLDLFSHSLQLTPLSPSIHSFLCSSWQLRLLRRMAGASYLWSVLFSDCLGSCVFSISPST